MASYTNYFVYCTDSIHSSAPDIHMLSWKDVVEFFEKFRTYVVDESTYGSLSNEEFGEAVADLVVSLLSNGKDEDEMIRYFGLVGAVGEASDDWRFKGSAWYHDSFSGYSTFVKCMTSLGELNAYKLLVEVMNRAAAEMGEDNTRYFFRVQTETYNLTAPQVAAGTIVANNLCQEILSPPTIKAYVDEQVTAKPKATASDFL